MLTIHHGNADCGLMDGIKIIMFTMQYKNKNSMVYAGKIMQHSTYCHPRTCNNHTNCVGNL
jgi:hypothetical protein